MDGAALFVEHEHSTEVVGRLRLGVHKFRACNGRREGKGKGKGKEEKGEEEVSNFESVI